ncbi:MAG: hypothetical protein K8H88_18815 [Sandaracinaceae bacterium]|nr:hypothetical protein [Sandaracinaceae bacterium]
MDPLREDDVRQMRETPPEEKARQALEMMQTGIRLKRAALRARHPLASDGEIEAMLQAWLDTED